jgi:hypothetical protein
MSTLGAVWRPARAAWIKGSLFALAAAAAKPIRACDTPRFGVPGYFELMVMNDGVPLGAYVLYSFSLISL